MDLCKTASPLKWRCCFYANSTKNKGDSWKVLTERVDENIIRNRIAFPAEERYLIFPEKQNLIPHSGIKGSGRKIAFPVYFTEEHIFIFLKRVKGGHYGLR